MAFPQKFMLITEEEYLSHERQALEKSEFYQGECFAMAGASRWHNLLSGRIFTLLSQYLEGQSCTPYIADMRLHIATHQHYVYPDVMVVCQENAYVADDMVNDAAMIIEVLSPSTESYDRGRKFLHYQSLSSLREYVLISQDTVQVEIFRRKDQHKWEYERLTELQEVLMFTIVQCSLPLEELYRSIPIETRIKS